ncbi:ABC transporter substrate-binding protein [Ensifer sp. ENS11]|uniref:ABC transporter substrate-binding protein n=1 Tax=Ensifer sp. ENS11 TaxID=2769291 RepID=UPI00177CDF4D|nr:ABC transporter substrate-binding protein [Ensifer sp. ENS11]MBD9489450.1 carbohydrate ABC transporter substrate-binding protein [Ensifer sp. ENS11]
MKRHVRDLIAAASVLLATTATVKADSDISHNWNSESEVAALRVFRAKYEALGGTWKETSFPDTEKSLASTKTRIIGGNPPMVLQSALGGTLKSFQEGGLLQDMDSVAVPENWDSRLPEVLAASVKYEGHYVAAPVFVDVINWMYTNNDVLTATGVSPPNSWSEFMTALPKIKAAGFIPLAVGGESWQEGILFDHALLSVGGADLYDAVMRGDVDSVDDGKLTEAFNAFGALREFTDEGKVGRSWNDTNTLMVTGKAAFFFMGPWAADSYASLGAEGSKWSCRLTPWSKALAVVSGGFQFIKVADENDVKAQALFATAVMDPATQIAAAQAMGTLPAVKSVDPTQFRGCVAKAGLAMKSGDIVDHWNGRTAIVGNALKDTVTAFWNSEMSSEDAVAAFKAALQ